MWYGSRTRISPDWRAMTKLALRNVFRHRRRTLVALAAIGFGVIALILASGFIEWIFWAMREGQFEDLDGAAQRILIDDEEDER